MLKIIYKKYFHKSLKCLEYFFVILNIQAEVPECLIFFAMNLHTKIFEKPLTT